MENTTTQMSATTLTRNQNDESFELKDDQPDERAEEMLEMLRQLKLNIADKSNECEMLKIKLDESQRDIVKLNQQLNECKLTIFERDEDAKKNNEESVKSKKLELDCVKLMSELLDMREQNDLYKQNMLANYLQKTNAINNFEAFTTSGALRAELDQSRLDFDEKELELSLAVAKLGSLEEENVSKEKNISELKKSLEDAKVTHQHEITVLQEYINCLKNTVTSYEKTLTSYESPIKTQESIEE